MKRFSLLLSVTMVAGVVSLLALENAPSIAFESSTKDFGKITQGQVLKHVFKFTNKGTGTLEIHSAEGS
ncbi:MAG: hypothetical protein DMG08_02770 [Acidobacteria bacterium]|nr:MAG: hypothetical protein DMG08_02770 [Acidobacteriota bacterium]PYU99317.1 MAG: hypothetical protein DMG10_25405 [Acidobacteriota bacterium]PYV42074.1 MAG: hypothetical protein DMG09_03245 [Acidobacteriota bacterium]